MKRILLVLLIGLSACNEDKTRKHYPSESYDYVAYDSASMQVNKSVYVPIYSHIYSQSGNRVLNLTSTLSIRNTGFNDSFYISKVDYYGSQGQILKRYLDSAVLVKPMSSIEFVVEEKESEGGAGANFVVSWHSADSTTEPLIQAVMTGTNTGVSFTTSSYEIK